MTEQEAVALLKDCQANDDTESAHANADDVLCNFLYELGYSDIVAEYQKVHKWYA